MQFGSLVWQNAVFFKLDGLIKRVDVLVQLLPRNNILAFSMYALRVAVFREQI